MIRCLNTRNTEPAHATPVITCATMNTDRHANNHAGKEEFLVSSQVYEKRPKSKHDRPETVVCCMHHEAKKWFFKWVCPPESPSVTFANISKIYVCISMSCTENKLTFNDLVDVLIVTFLVELVNVKIRYQTFGAKNDIFIQNGHEYAHKNEENFVFQT